jgi:hypothetical protein
MKLYISPDGDCQAIYDETLPLRSLGQTQIRRASHVESTPDGHWTADLSPVGGPCLGPFPVRSQALAAELAWLAEWLEGPSSQVSSRMLD